MKPQSGEPRRARRSQIFVVQDKGFEIFGAEHRNMKPKNIIGVVFLADHNQEIISLPKHLMEQIKIHDRILNPDTKNVFQNSTKRKTA